MTGERRPRRREVTLLVALLAALVALIVVTLRCRGVRDGDRSERHEFTTAELDASTHSAGGSTSPTATERPSPGARDAGTTPQARKTPRSRASAPDGVAPAETSAANGAAPSNANDAGDSSPYGRFKLVGDEDAQAGRGFGDAVAIDGEVAVVGAPRFKVDGVECGAAYVFERREGTWRQTQRLDAPRAGARRFAHRVGVAGGRVVVFGGKSADDASDAFRSYVRDDAGRWRLEEETRIGEPIARDATLRGDTCVVGVNRAVLVWRRADEKWTQTQRIDAPGSRLVGWLALSGDVLAVAGDQSSDNSLEGVHLYRSRSGAFELETRLDVGRMECFGTLGRDGRALVTMGDPTELVVQERGADGWATVVSAREPLGQLVTMHDNHPFAADGDLVVASSRDWYEFVILQRREDGWYRTTLAPKPDAAQVSRSGGIWPAWHPSVALNGRTAVVGTGWDGFGTGRAWIFDITDEDLARATKLASDAK